MDLEKKLAGASPKLVLYNTLGRRLEEFRATDPKNVKIYSCGPTVYWFQHIGNIRTYIFSDVLKKVLNYDGYGVKHVINVTDVGHLASDSDTGEDKMLNALKREGLPITADSMLQVADRYFGVFREDLKKVNVTEPDVWCKATENIDNMIELIKKLEGKKFTYRTGVGLIFDTSKVRNYGEIAGLKLDELDYGARVDVDTERKHSSDFALWVTNQPNHVMQWDSPWGKGFPGWHIECSAMSMKHLGNNFDIHTGGEEHIPVHHTNEIAQSEAATGEKFVNYWVHARWLLFKGEKMSKSKGEIYTLSELQKKAFDPLAYRYLCLTSHYRSQLSFSYESLENAQNSYNRLRNIVSGIKDDGQINPSYLSSFESYINDDLNMPRALGTLWDLVRDRKANGKFQTIRKMDSVFGLNLSEGIKISVPLQVEELVRERESARKFKKFDESDRLRKEIGNLGYAVLDTKEGPKVEKL